MKKNYKNYVEAKRNYLEELKKLNNKDEFLYIVYFDNNIKQFQEEYKNYVNLIKTNLTKPENLIEFNYSQIPPDKLNDFTFGKNVFPLLVVKEKNKGIEFIEGIRN